MPGRQGFEYFYGYLNQTHAHDYYPEYLWQNGERVTPRGGTYSHGLLTREALAFIRREDERPFFLMSREQSSRRTGLRTSRPSRRP